jgi:plasmid stabilization system protein ParE
MDTYRVDWTNSAEKDMRGIRRYISRQFSSQRARMYEKTIRFTVSDKLFSMPQKYRRLDDPLLAALGYRRMYVKSHTVLFVIEEEEKVVKVERVIHSKRDLINVLRGEQ